MRPLPSWIHWMRTVTRTQRWSCNFCVTIWPFGPPMPPRTTQRPETLRQPLNKSKKKISIGHNSPFLLLLPYVKWNPHDMFFPLQIFPHLKKKSKQGWTTPPIQRLKHTSSKISSNPNWWFWPSDFASPYHHYPCHHLVQCFLFKMHIVKQKNSNNNTCACALKKSISQPFSYKNIFLSSRSDW